MKAKILLIDDDEYVLKSIENLLKKEGYEVKALNNGLDAIEAVKKDNFDLIIADVRMPGIDGIETIKKIKEYQDKQGGFKSEFMVITGYADEDAPKEGALLGIDSFVLKPFDSKVFLDAVKNYIEGKKIETTKIEEKEIKIPIKLKNKYFSMEKTILLKDTNIMGNTYFANYILWQGEMREIVMMSHPNYAEEIKKYQNVHMITHSLYHRFVQETTFGDIVEIRGTVREIKKCSFVMVFRYFNKRTGAFVGEGWQRVAFIDKTTGTFCPIPAFIKELILAVKED